MPFRSEVSLRLDPARRQFFQWHFIENRPIVEVKDKMDQLTRDLKTAGYDYDFVADKNVWESRSRQWNYHLKSAWKIKKPQRGPQLSAPLSEQSATFWIEWGHDVGDWRKGHVRPHAAQVAQAHGLGDPGHVTGNYDGQDEGSTEMQAQADFDASSDHGDLSSNRLTYPPTSNLTELDRAFRDMHDAGRAVQQYIKPYLEIHRPIVPLLQNYDSPPQTTDPRDVTLPSFDKGFKALYNGPSGSDLWTSTFSTAASVTAPRPNGPQSWNTGSFHQHQHQHMLQQHQQPDIPAKVLRYEEYCCWYESKISGEDLDDLKRYVTQGDRFKGIWNRKHSSPIRQGLVFPPGRSK